MENNFLSRWSKLKSEKPVPVIKEEPIDDIQAIIDALPNIDDLKPGDALTAFMQKGVPDFIKNAAMRKMWATDAALTEHLCQPLDYAYDYNNPVGVMGFGAMPEGFDASEMMNKLFEHLTDEPVVAETLEIAPETEVLT
jgi:hypothetical protein